MNYYKYITSKIKYTISADTNISVIGRYQTITANQCNGRAVVKGDRPVVSCFDISVRDEVGRHTSI